MAVCSISGCSKPVFAACLCSTHYGRLRRTGTTDDGPRARISLEDRLWKHVRRGKADECWPWTSGVGGHGYGIIGLGGRGGGKEAAHRVVWRLTHGPLPKKDGHHGAVIRHKCNNRRCCNPAHLELGTQGDNVADMWKPGKRAKGNARLTPKQIAAIKSDPRSSRQIAPLYGVSDAHIRSIRNGRVWKS